MAPPEAFEETMLIPKETFHCQTDDSGVEEALWVGIRWDKSGYVDRDQLQAVKRVKAKTYRTIRCFLEVSPQESDHSGLTNQLYGNSRTCTLPISKPLEKEKCGLHPPIASLNNSIFQEDGDISASCDDTGTGVTPQVQAVPASNPTIEDVNNCMSTFPCSPDKRPTAEWCVNANHYQLKIDRKRTEEYALGCVTNILFDLYEKVLPKMQLHTVCEELNNVELPPSRNKEHSWENLDSRAIQPGSTKMAMAFNKGATLKSLPLKENLRSLMESVHRKHFPSRDREVIKEDAVSSGGDSDGSPLPTGSKAPNTKKQQGNGTTKQQKKKPSGTHTKQWVDDSLADSESSQSSRNQSRSTSNDGRKCTQSSKKHTQKKGGGSCSLHGSGGAQDLGGGDRDDNDDDNSPPNDHRRMERESPLSDDEDKGIEKLPQCQQGGRSFAFLQMPWPPEEDRTEVDDQPRSLYNSKPPPPESSKILESNSLSSFTEESETASNDDQAASSNLEWSAPRRVPTQNDTGYQSIPTALLGVLFLAAAREEEPSRSDVSSEDQPINEAAGDVNVSPPVRNDTEADAVPQITPAIEQSTPTLDSLEYLDNDRFQEHETQLDFPPIPFISPLPPMCSESIHSHQIPSEHNVAAASNGADSEALQGVYRCPIEEHEDLRLCRSEMVVNSNLSFLTIPDQEGEPFLNAAEDPLVVLRPATFATHIALEGYDVLSFAALVDAFIHYVTAADDNDFLND